MTVALILLALAVVGQGIALHRTRRRLHVYAVNIAACSRRIEMANWRLDALSRRSTRHAIRLANLEGK